MDAPLRATTLQPPEQLPLLGEQDRIETIRSMFARLPGGPEACEWMLRRRVAYLKEKSAKR